MSDKEVVIIYHLKVTVLIVLNIFQASSYYDKRDGLIYILIWKNKHFEPFKFIDEGQDAFVNCDFKNCFLTEDPDHLRHVHDFDVLMFNVVTLHYIDLPFNRTASQKYCLVGVEPAGYHSIPQEFDGFFNITFTYKLMSNITISNIVIQNKNDEIIGPKLDMQWKNLINMKDTSDFVKNKLENKHIAAAWFVSHCETPWRRIYAHDLAKKLARYGHSLDVYRKCGTKQCPRGNYGICDTFSCPQYEKMDECLGIIETDYYFYLSFENSFGEDYVTEKLLHALKHFSVPLVFGGANYSRYVL